jgi:hypothetical protein
MTVDPGHFRKSVVFLFPQCASFLYAYRNAAHWRFVERGAATLSNRTVVGSEGNQSQIRWSRALKNRSKKARGYDVLHLRVYLMICDFSSSSGSGVVLHTMFLVDGELLGSNDAAPADCFDHSIHYCFLQGFTR